MVRDLSDDLIDALSPLIRGLADDRELQPEIRDHSLTIYYRSAALIRDLQIENGNLVGAVHYKYIPLQRPVDSDYVPLIGTGEGLQFNTQPGMMSPGRMNPDVLTEYKRMIRSVGQNPESQIVHHIVCHPENLIVDQEIKFQTSGERFSDKIDLCHYDLKLGCLAFVEVKGIHDPRLKPAENSVPEVIDQLHRYRQRLEQQHSEIVEACSNSVSIKRRLGLEERLTGIPATRPLQLLKKPVLVIGHCSREDVREILEGASDWKPLREGLQEESAGLILCGNNGCQLDLRTGTQSRVFDDARF